MATRMPTLYLSHGAPPLADDTEWTRQLADWSGDLVRPKAILVVSAHWEDAPLTIGATTDDTPLTYDFWGFPQRYYDVTYAAPGAPALAERVRELTTGPGETLHQDPTRGLDHGAYVPLKEMYPEADIPVLQVSMPTLDPARLLELGRRLAPLRDEGVLIMGSGFTTHNLREMSRRTHGDAPSWSVE
ncbi:class III extradiol ring-cleavage dioxygenase, partial [Streptomyces sp. NPDC000931]